MKITIPQPQLLKTLQAVERAVNDRSTLPILSNVLLEAKEHELIVTATDLDVGIQCRFPLVNPVEHGAVALPARKLASIIRELQDEAVAVEVRKSHAATLSCGPSSFRVPGLPAEDFPTLPPPHPGEALVVPEWALKALISQAAYAMSTEEARFILNGALLKIQQDRLQLVATDGRRLALATTQLSRKPAQPLEAVVPAKAIRELGRLLQEDEQADVAIAPLKDNQLTFRFGSTTIVTRLIEGQFPQYEKVIPPPSKQTLTCDRQALMSAIRRAGLMTTATSQAVVFDLAPNRVTISKESPELGSAHEELVATYRGEPATVAFNPGFWLEALRTLDGSDVTVELAGAERPAVIRRENFIYLVLPMKVT